MASSRWLKSVEDSPQAKKAEDTPNVSMNEVRRLSREKFQKSEPEDKNPQTAPVAAPVVTPVDATVVTTAQEHTPVAAHTQTLLPAGPDSGAEAGAKTAQPQYLDATHTASEQRVYSVMYRETISKGFRERHYGPKELCTKTGIRSDRTVRMAVRGLVKKLSIEVVSHNAYFPQGPRYRVFEPRDVARRRKAAGIEIDPQTKQVTTPVDATVGTTVRTPSTTLVSTGADGTSNNYSSTPVGTTGVSPVEVTGLYKERNSIGGSETLSAPSSSNLPTVGADDEAFAGLFRKLSGAAKELTGRDPGRAEADRWSELGDVIVTELKIAAARTTVSNVPAFLAEHLRRRLFKKDKQQIEREAGEGRAEVEAAPDANVTKCPDCGGSGYWYPEGYEKGVAKCRHEKLSDAAR